MTQLVINALIAGSLAALIAGGLALVYGVLGVFNMALGQLALSGGFVTWWLYRVAELPLPWAILGGLITGSLLAWCTFELCVSPFYRHHRFLPIVTTIAWSMVLDAALLLLFEERPQHLLRGLPQMIHLADITIGLHQLLMVFCTVFVLAFFAWLLHGTLLGRRIRATVQHPEAARSLGISSSLLHRLLFIASGFLAAAGGIFLATDQNITPTMAFSLTIKAYAAVIAGGKGNVWGAVVCAYVIALLEQLAVGLPWWGGSYISSGYQAVVALLCIIGFLLVRPHGLFGHSSRSA